MARTRSVASLPCKIVLEDLIQPPSKKPCYHQGGRRETASGFYPWGKMDSPRERVVEGLCGWWHGNSFPMTQSAQSHRQMRSIPLCSKAVFYVFCFRAPSIYPLNRKNGRHFRLGEMPPLFVLNPDFGDCQLVGVLVILPPLLLCR